MLNQLLGKETLSLITLITFCICASAYGFWMAMAVILAIVLAEHIINIIFDWFLGRGSDENENLPS